MRRQISIALCAALVASLAGCQPGSFGSGDLGADLRAHGDMTDLTGIDPVGNNPQVIKLNIGVSLSFANGPLWLSKTGVLLFTDNPANLIYQFKLPSTLSTYRMNSNGANSLAVDGSGNVIAAEFKGLLTRADQSGVFMTIASMYMSKQLNGPDDAVVRSDGTIYFTDPSQGGPSPDSIYKLAPTGGTLTLLDQTVKFPSGIALSPDEKFLYVVGSNDFKVSKFPVNADGTVGTRSDFVTNLGACSGLNIDDAGNLYVATTSGIRIFKADGSPRGSINVPEPPSNLSFGGADRRTLFISARTSIYQVQVQVPGKA